MAAFCADTKTVIKASSASENYPDFIPDYEVDAYVYIHISNSFFSYKASVKALCTPVCSDIGDLEAVLELVRTSGVGFSDQEMETINSYLVWGGLVLSFADRVCANNEDKILTDFLASVVRCF